MPCRRNPLVTAMQHPPQLAKNAPCAGALDGHDEHPFVRRNRGAPAGSSMIGLVLVTHGRLAVEFRAALEHVVGPQGQIEAITIFSTSVLDVDDRDRALEFSNAMDRMAFHLADYMQRIVPAAA